MLNTPQPEFRETLANRQSTEPLISSSRKNLEQEENLPRRESMKNQKDNLHINMKDDSEYKALPSKQANLMSEMTFPRNRVNSVNTGDKSKLFKKTTLGRASVIFYLYFPLFLNKLRIFYD